MGMGKMVTAGLLLLSVLGLGNGCGGEQTETIGSETNWLACDSDADCSQGGQCLCGVCTTECETVDSCGSSTEVCVTRGDEAYDDLCVTQTTTTTPGGVCLAACGAGVPCAAGSYCVAGACMPAKVQPADFVGRACTPEDEGHPRFSGWGVAEINIEDPSAQCSGGYCMGYHFQGRVSCPYGGTDCETTDGEPLELDGASVLPQRLDRPAADNVFCTCGCAGPEGSGPFCACPDGSKCMEMIPDLGLEPKYPTHYCVKDALEPFDPTTPPGGVCDRELANCEDR
jgi:hypothetical protein